MTKFGLFYGSTSGNTEVVAEKIKKNLGPQADLHNILGAVASDMNPYDVLILGSSTWGEGELQDDWEDFIDRLDGLDFRNKNIALYGLGDQESYPDSFVDAMGVIHEKVSSRGARIIGYWPTEGYTFNNSRAVVHDHFVGLALDEDNEPHLTDDRIKSWVEQLQQEL